MFRSCRHLKNKQLKDRRILARRDNILKELLSPKSELFCATRPNTEYVWVDSNFLRRFFSCRDDLEDLFRGSHYQSSVLRHNPFVCEHSNGLHPRVAREGMSKLLPPRTFLAIFFSPFLIFIMFSGKLLPAGVYDKLQDIVKHEYDMFMHDQRLDMTSPRLPIFSLFDDSNHTIICKTCGISYQQETKRKIDVFTVSYLLPFENSFVSSVT
jgi:hypothetical protein